MCIFKVGILVNSSFFILFFSRRFLARCMYIQLSLVSRRLPSKIHLARGTEKERSCENDSALKFNIEFSRLEFLRIPFFMLFFSRRFLARCMCIQLSLVSRRFSSKIQLARGACLILAKNKTSEVDFPFIPFLYTSILE